jgi:hypothetical protein
MIILNKTRIAFIGGALILGIMIFRSCTIVDDCRSISPEELRSFIEKNHRQNMMRWRKDPQLDPESIEVSKPILYPVPTTIDWTATITGTSKADGKTYEYSVMVACGYTMDYSGPKLVKYR